MEPTREKLAEPVLIERACGGWLAVSKPESPLKIGVTAETEDGARMAFDRAVGEWSVLTDESAEKVGKAA